MSTHEKAKPTEVSAAPRRSGAPPVLAKPRKEWRVKKVVRLLAFCSTVCLVGAALAARSAYGHVLESALSLGHELGTLGDAGSKHPLRLNGQEIYVASHTASLPLHEVLDRMESACRQDSIALVTELNSLTEDLKQKIPGGVTSTEAAGIVRKEQGTNGFVACFVREGMPRENVTSVAARLTSMIETGDLNQLGKLRYVFGERTREGRTHIVTVWTDGPFNVYNLFPQFKGDAPGADPIDVPRPIDSTRLLTADIEGVPYGVHLYESTTRYQDVLAHYDVEMPKRGWEVVLSGEDGEANKRAYKRGEVVLMVFAGPATNSDRTLVSLIQMRSP